VRASSRASAHLAPTRTVFSSRRCLRALVQSPTNGAAAKEIKIFRTVEVDGVKYVSVSQVRPPRLHLFHMSETRDEQTCTFEQVKERARQ